MARIDWALLCELAFLDRHDRLNAIGVFHGLPTPQLPIVLRQAMLVAHLADIGHTDEFTVTVGIVTPDGRVITASADGGVIEVAHQYVFVSLRDLSLRMSGVYRFRIGLVGQPPFFIDVPVTTEATVTGPRVH